MQSGNSSTAAADDFVPAPDASASGTVSNREDMAGTLDNAGALAPIKVDAGVGQTAMILSLVAFLVVAGLLLLVRSAVRKSLIAGRATIDSANAASWSWYGTLLLFTGLLIGGIVGKLFTLTSYVGLTVGVLLLGVGLSATLTSRARRSA